MNEYLIFPALFSWSHLTPLLLKKNSGKEKEEIFVVRFSPGEAFSFVGEIERASFDFLCGTSRLISIQISPRLMADIEKRKKRIWLCNLLKIFLSILFLCKMLVINGLRVMVRYLN